MARPKKDIPPAKVHQLPVRFTEELYAVLSEYAEKAHMSRGEYIRSLVAGKRPVVHQEVIYDSTELLKVFRNLGNITGNLNQIARHLNQGGRMTEAMRRDISYCIAQILHMRDEIKQMAGEYRGDC